MTKLSRIDTELFQRLIRGPLPHSALSRDILVLMKQLGSVKAHGHGKLLITISSRRKIFPRPKGKHMTDEELSELRHFLLATKPLEVSEDESENIGSEATSVVVIDHHKARFYRTTRGSRPEHAGSAVPYDPHGFHRHLIHRKQANYVGDRVPEDPIFYKEIAQALQNANSIVIIGHGSGKSNAATHLIDYLKKDHPAIAIRIIDTNNADLSALTEPQIEELAERHVRSQSTA